jgi:hypothetical protein
LKMYLISFPIYNIKRKYTLYNLNILNVYINLLTILIIGSLN